MAAAEAGFEESLCEALSGINLETVSLRVKQKEAIRNIVLLKKDTLIILPTGFGKSLGSLSKSLRPGLLRLPEIKLSKNESWRMSVVRI